MSFIGLSIVFGILICIGIFWVYFSILLAEFFALTVMAKITIFKNTPETRKAFSTMSKR
jgi:hypothetical protein